MEKRNVVRIKRENDVLIVDFSEVRKDLILKVVKLTSIPEGDLIHPEINIRILREILNDAFESRKEICFVI